jgi:stage V sporulation protein D (sporulation-specific penicillin-binding protein)
MIRGQAPGDLGGNIEDRLRDARDRRIGGNGKNAYIKGFRVAGKTGTSEKRDTADETDRIASFAAIAPADDPQLVCLIILDEPRGGSTGGGAIAAPVARAVLEDVLKYMEVKPEYTAEELESLDVLVPDVLTMNLAERKRA